MAWVDSTVLEICVGCMKVGGRIQVQGLHGRQHVLLQSVLSRPTVDPHYTDFRYAPKC